MLQRLLKLAVFAAPLSVAACATSASMGGSGGPLAAGMVTPDPNARYSFRPDWTFQGSALTGWSVLGQADWRASNGELIATARNPAGGWLMLDRGLQDVEVGFDYRAAPGAEVGVLLRAERTATGYKGIYVSLTGGRAAAFALTLDANGRELSREPLRAGGGLVRTVPTAAEAAAAAAARAANAGGGAGGGGGGGGGAGGQAPAAPAGPTLARPDMTEPSEYRQNDWNDANVVVDANILRAWVNKGGAGGSASGAADEELGAFGPIALYVGGTGEVRFRGVSYKDYSLKDAVAEVLSPNYRMMRLTPFYYSFASAVADFDRDGNPDIVSGPFIFYGPEFTKKREFYLALPTRPGVDFSSNWLEFAGDFTGDGWPDVLLASTSGTILYVNPRGEARRWDAHRSVVPPGATVAEVSAMKDVDGDGVDDLVYMSSGAIRWAKPDPANPNGPWLTTQVGEQGSYVAHGIGAGDINGDGRVDILNAYGWWENPGNATTPMWTYHPVAFGRQNGRGSAGGAEMCVYDVNGDGLNDVVSVLQAHAFGMAWFEQRRDANGNISFAQHMISDDFASPSAGGVVFSEPHGTACADMDGDGIPDFVVGKRYYSHQESTTDPDPYGPPVLYVFKTRRDRGAPGAARFEPELVHNASGAGSQLVATDLNGDGINDIVTAGELGAFVFFGRR